MPGHSPHPEPAEPGLLAKISMQCRGSQDLHAVPGEQRENGREDLVTAFQGREWTQGAEEEIALGGLLGIRIWMHRKKKASKGL